MKGKWIWLDEKIIENTYGEFLVCFDYTGGKAILEISADTEYAFFVNDAFVNAGQYADFPWYKVRDSHDITHFLKKGENRLKLVVWYKGDNNFCNYVNRPALRFELTVEGRLAACSSAQTDCKLCGNFVSGEVRKIDRQLGYSFVWKDDDGGAYHKAVELSDMPEETFSRPIENLELLPFRKAEGAGSIYDLGEETVGYPCVVFRAPKGERINVAFGEWLRDGHVPRFFPKLTDGRDFSFELVGNGERATAFNPLRKLGCRYLEVTGNCEVFEIGLMPLRYPFEQKQIQINNGLRKRIYETAVKTLELNAFDHYYDCPWREQAFWTLDGRFQMRYGYYAFEDTRYQRAALKLLSEERRKDRLISMVVPSSSGEAIPSFALSYVMAMAEYAEFSGDLSLAEEYFGRMRKLLNEYVNRMENGLVACFDGFWNFYEWNDRLCGNGGKRFDAVLNLLTVYALQKYRSLCESLGKAEESVWADGLICGLKKEIRKRFYDQEDGLFRTFEDEKAYSELVNSLAVLCDALGKDEAERICDKMVKGGEMISATLSMTAFKYDALLKTDTSKYGSYILKEIDDSFGYMLSCGATAFWETLKGAEDMDGAGSLCHGWSALPVYYYTLLGAVKTKKAEEKFETGVFDDQHAVDTIDGEPDFLFENL